MNSTSHSGRDGDDTPSSRRDTDPDDNDDIDPDDIDPEFALYMGAWEQAASDAMALLRQALPEMCDTPPPQPDLDIAATRIRAALSEASGTGAKPTPGRTASLVRETNGWDAGWDADPDDPAQIPADNAALVIACAAALMVVETDPGFDDDFLGLLHTLQFADWLAAAIGLARSGPGTSTRPDAIVAVMGLCPEIPEPVGDDDRDIVEAAFAAATLPWQLAGVCDDAARLTPLGAWALPRLLAYTWDQPFDA